MILVLGGRIAVGKTTAAARLSRPGVPLISARHALVALGQLDEPSREELQAFGSEIEDRTHGRWLADWMATQVQAGQSAILDSARTAPQVDGIRQTFGSVTFVLLEASEEQRRARYKRGLPADILKSGTPFDQAANDPIESSIDDLRSIADLLLNTDDSTPVEVVEAIEATW